MKDMEEKKNEIIRKLRERRRLAAMGSGGQEETRYIERRECRRCGAKVGSGEKYCEHCGESLANPRIRRIDYRDLPVLYGPPPIFTNVVCRNCGAEWAARRKENDPEDKRRYCPQCGVLTILADIAGDRF